MAKKRHLECDAVKLDLACLYSIITYIIPVDTIEIIIGCNMTVSRHCRNLLGGLALYSLLTLRASTCYSPASPVKRVAIIGSGIAGLSLAHALTNSPELAKYTPGSKIEVSLFDSRSCFDFNAGSGVQLNGGKHITHTVSWQMSQTITYLQLFPLSVLYIQE